MINLKKIDMVVLQNNSSYPEDGRYDTVELNKNIIKYITKTYSKKPVCLTKGNVTHCNKIFETSTVRHYYHKKL